MVQVERKEKGELAEEEESFLLGFHSINVTYIIKADY